MKFRPTCHLRDPHILPDCAGSCRVPRAELLRRSNLRRSPSSAVERPSAASGAPRFPGFKTRTNLPPAIDQESPTVSTNIITFPARHAPICPAAPIQSRTPMSIHAPTTATSICRRAPLRPARTAPARRARIRKASNRTSKRSRARTAGAPIASDSKVHGGKTRQLYEDLLQARHGKEMEEDEARRDQNRWRSATNPEVAIRP